jgi:hypothetical protein
MKKSELKDLIKEVLKEEMLKPSEDAIRFAQEIADKMSSKMRKQGQMGYADIDALRDMIAYKLTKEKWITGDEAERMDWDREDYRSN